VALLSLAVGVCASGIGRKKVLEGGPEVAEGGVDAEAPAASVEGRVLFLPGCPRVVVSTIWAPGSGGGPVDLVGVGLLGDNGGLRNGLLSGGLAPRDLFRLACNCCILSLTLDPMFVYFNLDLLLVELGWL